MQELIFKNYFKSLFIFVFGIIASVSVAFIYFSYIDIPLPLLILGATALFMLGGFVFYPRATTIQTLQIIIIGIFVNAMMLIATYFLNYALELPQISIKPDFVLSINPLAALAGFIFSLLTLCVCVKFEEIKEESAQIEQTEETITEEKPLEAKQEILKENIAPQEVIEIHKINLNSPKATEKEDSERLKPLENEELSDIIELKTSIDYIPTDIRLIQNTQSKLNDQKAKIGSIGKLLVNNKDIGNLIESEELLNTKTNVITTLSGQKMYEKFQTLKSDYDCLQEMALIDHGGFVLAHNFEDTQRAHLAAALVSGAYHTIQNYISQLNLAFPVRIFFETAKSNCFITKTKEEILFSIWNKEFQHVDFGPMTEILEAEDFEKLNIVPYVDLIKIENFVVADSEGKLVNYLQTAECTQLFAAVSSAIFENLKVFLMNIKLLQLSKIVIYTPQKTITIIKPQDKIVAFLTDTEEYPKVSDELLSMEEI